MRGATLVRAALRRSAVASGFRVLLAAFLFGFSGLEASVRPVHAVAQAGWLRPIRKYMAEMGLAARATHLGPPHQEGPVLMLGHGLAFDRPVEARPAGSRT